MTSQYATELRTLIEDVVGGRQGTETADEALALWETLGDLGLTRIGVPEEHGGSGGGLDDLLVVIEALAAHGVSTPLAETSVADWVLGGSGPLGPRMSTIVVLPEAVPATRGRAVGAVSGVPWGRHADRLVLCVPDGPAAVVDLRHPSVTIRAGENLASEPRDTVVLTGTPVETIAGAPTRSAIRARLALAWSAAVTGAAHGAYRLTRGHVAQRRQFDAPLLKIPAVASGLAVMRVRLVQADAALARARAEIAVDPEDGRAAVAVARITTAAAATEIAHLAHQLHGALGITREYPLHHYTRRLWAWRDAVASEPAWCADLGRRASLSEETIWTELTPAER